jgi:hypothetical protein
MTGIDNKTGTALSGIDHLKQSIRDILTTPIGTRVMRRDYGSRNFELIDAPMNGATIINIVAATAEALDKWEPRLILDRVIVNSATADGKFDLSILGKYRPDGKQIKLDGILL